MNSVRTTFRKFTLAALLVGCTSSLAVAQFPQVYDGAPGDATITETSFLEEYTIDFGRFVDPSALVKPRFFIDANGDAFTSDVDAAVGIYSSSTATTPQSTYSGFGPDLFIGFNPNYSFSPGAVTTDNEWRTTYSSTTRTTTVTGTKVDNRVLSAASPATINLGRVYTGNTNINAAINVGVTTAGDHSAFTDVQMATGTSTATSTGDSTTQTVSGGPVLFDDASDTATVTNLNFTFNSAGAKSGTAFASGTIAPGETAKGAGNSEVAVANFTATAVDARSVTGSIAQPGFFGKVVKGSSYTMQANLTTTGSDDEKTRVTLGSGAITGNSGLTSSSSAVLGAGSTTVFNADGVSATRDVTLTIGANETTGNKFFRNMTFGLEQEALDGAPSATLALQYSISVFQNRTFTTPNGESSPYYFKTLTDTDDSATLSVFTTGSNSNTTTVLFNAGTATSDDGGVTATNGLSSNFFQTGTKSYELTANYDTSGTKTGFVNVAELFSDAENAAVKAVVQDTLNVHYEAEVYVAADLIANNAHRSGNGDEVILTNSPAAGEMRAAAEVVGTSIDESRFSLSGLEAGTQIAAGESESGTVNVDQSGLLNGAILTGNLLVNLEHADQSIEGTSAGDLGSLSWGLQHVVSNNVSSSGMANLGAGETFGGLSLANANSQATLRDGDASGSTMVEMEFITNSQFAVTNDDIRIGEILVLTGTGTDIVVIEMNYDPLSLGEFAEENLRLGWLDEVTGEWVLAVDGNDGGTPNFIEGAYNSGLFALGNHGLDTVNNTVWAVINHNSEFSVTAVPEPTSAALLFGALGLLAARRRKA